MSLIQKTSIQTIYAPIEQDLEVFRVRLSKELESADTLIQDIHSHLLKMGGKFLRPALTILCSKLKDETVIDKAITLSVVMELIHTATLIHDDIIDNSELRRNQPSLYFKYGKEISIVSGDYLYAKAFLALSSLKDASLNTALATCAHIMCEGEMKQIELRQDFLMSEDQYLKIIHKKTACLFQAACMGGAYLTGFNPSQIDKLGVYGYSLGMAFQIVDDCLDLVGDEESLGKTIGLDIYKNDVTLPILYLFKALGTASQSELLNAFKTQAPNLFERVKTMAQETGSVEKAMNKAKAYIADAKESLKNIPDSRYKDSLGQLALFCIERIR